MSALVIGDVHRVGDGTLTGATLKDRLRIVSLLARRAGRDLRRVALRPGRAALAWRAKVPERLLIAPQDIRTSDPTIAADIGAGYFAFGGKIVNARGRSPFAGEPDTSLVKNELKGADTQIWMRQLAGFGWLRHLRAADTPGARSRARVLVDAFLTVQGRGTQGVAWEPRVAARRMLAWLSQSPVILEGADRPFYNRFMQALATHRIVLDHQLNGGLAGEDRLLAALALAEFGLCVQGAGPLQKRGTDALATEIAIQVLPDGGHISRNPQMLIDLLLDLLPLRQAYAARGIQAPSQVLNAIDRMMPMLRLFRHGDGTLALFNGMGLTAPELVATILAYDDARAQPLSNAPYAGYQRLEAERSIVVVDAGTVPPTAFSTRANAGCLSFEFSIGSQRLVINCGAPEVSRANAREAARTTAAHSTLIVDDTSSCRFAGKVGLQRLLGDQILSGPGAVTAERSRTEGGDHALELSHDGYLTRFSLIHHRTLILGADGTRLEGHDELEDASKRGIGGPFPYTVRFHLHPAIKARAFETGVIRLDAPDGSSWLFEADAPTFVEPSVLFAAPGGPRPTNQIRVATDTSRTRDVRWNFKQVAQAERR